MAGAFRIAVLTVENTSRQQDPDIRRLQRGITPQVSEPLQTRWGSTSNGHVVTGDEDFACELDCQLDVVEAAARVYNAVNNLHVFREGNGRTQRQWMNSLAHDAGFELNWQATSRDENDSASHAARAEGDLAGLRELFVKIVVKRSPAERGSALTEAREAAATAYRGRATHRGAGGAQPPTARPATPTAGRGSTMRPQGPGRA